MCCSMPASVTSLAAQDLTWRKYLFKCGDEEECMHWINALSRVIALRIQAHAHEVEARNEQSGTVSMGAVGEIVRSLGGDLKYIKVGCARQRLCC